MYVVLQQNILVPDVIHKLCQGKAIQLSFSYSKMIVTVIAIKNIATSLALFLKEY